MLLRWGQLEANGSTVSKGTCSVAKDVQNVSVDVSGAVMRCIRMAIYSGDSARAMENFMEEFHVTDGNSRSLEVLPFLLEVTT